MLQLVAIIIAYSIITIIIIIIGVLVANIHKNELNTHPSGGSRGS